MNPLVKSLKKVIDGVDGMDIFIFCLVFLICSPLAIIWLAVRIIQEWE